MSFIHYDFLSEFSREAEVKASASGRVNLIGEHTDYNGGFVLPTPIPQKTDVQIARRHDDLVSARSSSVEKSLSKFEYRLGQEKKRGSWGDYLQGVTWVLQQEGFKHAGFEMIVDSEVPMGSGLSSSAAFEVSVLKALREAFGLKISDVELALLGQKVENKFVGANVGIMDQMACSLAHHGEALFLDTRNLEFRRVPLPAELDLIVINSGITHHNVGNEYNLRRQQCELACEKLGVKFLRDIEAGDVAKLDSLEITLQKRARHIVTENARVLTAVRALEVADFITLGRLFNESHDSMKADYEISVAGIDQLVKIAQDRAEVFGARMTGGGFGGSIVAIAKKNTGKSVAVEIARDFAQNSEFKPTVLVS